MSEVKYTEEEIEKIKDRILEALEMVIDPELGIDIVNLGLIYDIRFQQDGYTEIDMTLTTMGCPLADLLTDQIYDAMKEVPEVTKTEVKLVWTPAWTIEKMSRYARIALGISLGEAYENTSYRCPLLQRGRDYPSFPRSLSSS